MRKMIFVVALVLAVSSVAYAGPNEITYQGKLTDLGGVPVVGDTAVIFTIYDADTAGTALWAETLAVTTGVNGVFTVELGGIYPIGGGTLDGGSRFLGIQVVGDTEMTPRQSLNSAPYSAGGLPSVGQVTLSGSTNATTPTELDRFTAQVPGPGVLLVTVEGNYWLDADATSTVSRITTCFLGLCTTPNSSGTCGGTYGDFYHQDADNASSTNETPSFTLTRTFNVAAAGPMTFYVNGQSSGAAPVPTLFLYGGHCKATVIWFPSAMTVQLSKDSPGSGVELQTQAD